MAAGARIRGESWQEVCQGFHLILHLPESRSDRWELHPIWSGDVWRPALAARDEADANHHVAAPSRPAESVRGDHPLGHCVEPGQDDAVGQEEMLQLLLHAPAGDGCAALRAGIFVAREGDGAVDPVQQPGVRAADVGKCADGSVSWRVGSGEPGPAPRGRPLLSGDAVAAACRSAVGTVDNTRWWGLALIRVVPLNVPGPWPGLSCAPA